MKSLFSVSICLLLANGVAAQTATNKVCDLNDSCGGFSGAQLTACIGELFSEEDRRLNANFQDLIAQIRTTPFENPEGLVDELRQSQRNWLVYRDSFCPFRFSTAEGGTIAGLLKVDCECTLTRDKADHLADDLTNLSGAR